MAQAKTFTKEEFEMILEFVSHRRFALRNRMLILMSFWTGMRVGEIASLRIEDVVDRKGRVKAEIRLDASQTKGKYPRTVFFPSKLCTELQNYVDSRIIQDRNMPFFMTAGGKSFSANVLAQHFFWLYKKAGIDGASSHSGRRSFLTSLSGKSVSIRVLASLAGHRSTNVTLRYLDANDDMKRNAVELI